MPEIGTSIWIALRTRLEALALTPPIEVAWFDENYEPGSVLEPYLSVTLLPNSNERPWIGSDEPAIRRGILQVMVMYPTGLNHAITWPLEIAGKIAAHFPPDLPMTYAGVTVHVERHPDISRPFKDDQDHPSFWQVPVSIRYWCEA